MINQNKTYEEERDEAAYSYEIPTHRNCYGCCQNDADYENAFKAGADWGRAYKESETDLRVENLSAIVRKIHRYAVNREPSVACKKIDETFKNAQHILSPVSALRANDSSNSIPLSDVKKLVEALESCELYPNGHTNMKAKETLTEFKKKYPEVIK